MKNENKNVNPYINEELKKSGEKQSLLGGFDNGDFIKGALIGATVGYLLTNEKAQKTIMKTFAKGTQVFQMGIEEMKERFEDVKAEMENS